MKFKDMIDKKKTSAADSKKKKSSAPVITLPDELIPKLVEFQAEKKKEKEAKALKSSAEAPVIQHCKEVQDQQAFAGNYNGSFDVKGGDSLVKFVSSDAFSVSQDEEVQGQLQELLGDEYEKVIEEETSISMKPEVFQDEKLQSKLVKALGDNFDDFFETSSSLKVKKGFAEKIHSITKDPAKLAQIRTLITQKKPALK